MSSTVPSRPVAEVPTLRVRQRGPVSVVPLVALVTVTVLAYIGLSVVFAPPSIVDQNGTALPYNFKSERGTITLLSTAMFLFAAVFAGRALATVRAERGRTRTLWLLLTVVMTYFTVDEVAQFHERSGDFLDANLPTGPFRTYNDVIVIMYGFVALPAALFLWREVLRYPRLLTMLVITGVLYVATTSVDTFTEDATPVSVVIEEGIKVCCSTYFALSMLTGLVGVRWRFASTPRLRAASGVAEGRPNPLVGLASLWLCVVGQMLLIALFVLAVSRPMLRVLLDWAVAGPMAFLVLRLLTQVDGLPGASRAAARTERPERPEPAAAVVPAWDGALPARDGASPGPVQAAPAGPVTLAGLLPPVRPLLAIYLPPVALLAFFLALHEVTGVDFGLISRDQAQEFTHLSADAYTSIKAFPLIGFQSTLSGLIWFGGFAVSLVALALLRRRGQLAEPRSRFLMAVSFLTLFLGADDIFMFHDELAPRYLKVLEQPFILFYVGSILAVLVVFRRSILAMDPVLFLLGVGCFAGSVAVDHFQESLEWWHYRIFAEDGFKFLGIVGWCGYLIRQSWLVVAETARPAEAAPAAPVPAMVSPAPVAPAAPRSFEPVRTVDLDRLSASAPMPAQTSWPAGAAEDRWWSAL
jgi:hypothetical protein